MTDKTIQELLQMLIERVYNAEALASVVSRAAFGKFIEVTEAGASCEVLKEYLTVTADIIERNMMGGETE